VWGGGVGQVVQRWEGAAAGGKQTREGPRHVERAEVPDLGIALLAPHGVFRHVVNFVTVEWLFAHAGGVSMGDRDLLKPLLQCKGSVHFGRVLTPRPLST
jgi:hypothetical protein